MAVSTTTTSTARPVPIFHLEMLGSLPCGCVAAAFRARIWDVSIISIEAKGPHCILSGHASGQVLRLGDSAETEMSEEPV